MSLSTAKCETVRRTALSRPLGLAALFFALATTSALAGANSALIFDASNSMNSPFDSGSRMEAAKSSLAETVPGFTSELDLGLVVFGHRETQNCSDIEIKLQSRPGNAARIASALSSVEAQGVSGLANTLIKAAEAVDYRNRSASIIVLADSAGVNNCRVDTCATIERLRQESTDLVVHLIAVGAKDAEIPHLQCIASSTGGHFTRARTRGELTAGLNRAFALASQQEQSIEIVLPPRPKPAPRVADANAQQTAPEPNGAEAFAPGEIEAETQADAAAALEQAAETEPENRVSVFAPTRPGEEPGSAPAQSEPDASAGETPENVSNFAPSAPAPDVAESAPQATGAAAVSEGEAADQQNASDEAPSAPESAAAAPDAAETITPQALTAAEAAGQEADGATSAASMQEDDTPRVMAIADGSDEFLVSVAPQAPDGSTILVKRRGEGAGASALDDDEQAASDQAVSGVSVRPAAPAADGRVKLSALIIENTKPVGAGVEWEVFSAGDASAPSRVVARSSEAAPEIAVPAGEYLIKGKFGAASRSKRVLVKPDQTENLELVLGAGGLQIDPVNAGSEDPGDDVLNTIYAAGTTSQPIADKVASGKVIYLNAGVYRIESRYGSANAIARADIEVQPGKLVKAKINHRAGPAILKLTEQAGGEELSGVAWKILSLDGSDIFQSDEASPRAILAEGTYQAVATHGGNTYRSSFQIKPGEQTLVEIATR